MAYVDITANSASSYVENYGPVYGKAETVQRPSASLIKIVTALVARDWINDANLNNTVTVESGDTHGPTTAQLQVGDVITWSDLFYGMLLPSGNDAAKTIGREVGELILASEGGGGDARDRFVVAMNDKLSALGLAGANAATAYGAEESSTLSAADSVAVMREAAADPFLRTVMGALSHGMTVTGVNARSYTVTHTVSPFVGTFPEFIAAKTGTVTSGANVVMLWTPPSGGEAVSTINASTSGDRYNDLREVMDFAIQQASAINGPIRVGQMVPGITAGLNHAAPVSPPTVVNSYTISGASVSTSTTSVDVSSITCQPQDLEVVVLMYRVGETSVVTPAGWTLEGRIYGSEFSFPQGLAVYSRVLAGTSTGVTTFAYSSGSGRMQAGRYLFRRDGVTAPTIDQVIFAKNVGAPLGAGDITPSGEGVTASATCWTVRTVSGTPETETFQDGVSVFNSGSSSNGPRLWLYAQGSAAGAPFNTEWATEALGSIGGQGQCAVNFNVI